MISYGNGSQVKAGDRVQIMNFEGENISLQDALFVDNITGDVENFRVRSTNLARVLIFPPVNNYHRFLIHKVVETGFPQFTTFSVGEGAERRTVVCFQEHLLQHTLAFNINHQTIEECPEEVTEVGQSTPPDASPSAHNSPGTANVDSDSTTSKEIMSKVSSSDPRESCVVAETDNDTEESGQTEDDETQSHPQGGNPPDMSSLSSPGSTNAAPADPDLEPSSDSPAEDDEASSSANDAQPKKQLLDELSSLETRENDSKELKTSSGEEPQPNDDSREQHEEEIIAPEQDDSANSTMDEKASSAHAGSETTAAYAPRKSESPIHLSNDDNQLDHGSKGLGSDPLTASESNELTAAEKRKAARRKRPAQAVYVPPQGRRSTNGQALSLPKPPSIQIPAAFMVDNSPLQRDVGDGQKAVGPQGGEDSGEPDGISASREACLAGAPEPQLADIASSFDNQILSDIVAAVGDVQIESPEVDYLAFQTSDSTMSIDQFGHVIELYHFPSDYKTEDLMAAFSAFTSRWDIKWVDDTHALGVFSSTEAAAEALAVRHPTILTRPLSMATPQSKSKARSVCEELLPYKPRPATNTGPARRILQWALGSSAKVPGTTDLEVERLYQARLLKGDPRAEEKRRKEMDTRVKPKPDVNAPLEADKKGEDSSHPDSKKMDSSRKGKQKRDSDERKDGGKRLQTEGSADKSSRRDEHRKRRSSKSPTDYKPSKDRHDEWRRQPHHHDKRRHHEQQGGRAQAESDRGKNGGTPKRDGGVKEAEEDGGRWRHDRDQENVGGGRRDDTRRSGHKKSSQAARSPARTFWSKEDPWQTNKQKQKRHHNYDEHDHR